MPSLSSEVAPDYVGALTLHLDPSLNDEFMGKYGEPFEFLDDAEVLDEPAKGLDPDHPVNLSAVITL